MYVDNLWSELQRTGAGGEMEFNKIVDYVESPQLASKLKKKRTRDFNSSSKWVSNNFI